jgi:hypothetical protein
VSLRQFIRDQVLLPRLLRAGVLVAYDPDLRYRDLCLSLAGDETAVVDAGASSIESREAALEALAAGGHQRGSPKGLLVYVPARAPVTDEDRQADPFSVFAACGAVFPDGDGEEFLNLCLRAKPDHVTEVRRLFEQGAPPSFEMVDNVGGGLRWPTLRTVLKVESARDIIFALLAPSSNQIEALKANDGWAMEAKALLETTLDLKLITRGKTWSSIADELWRFLLFSEFRLDLPGNLPSALASVPAAAHVATPLVEDLCDRLRSDIRTRAVYVDRAAQVEKDLGLAQHCAAILDLGARDTFPFEERAVAALASAALKEQRLDDVRQILERHGDSVWIERGESQAEWGLLQSALDLVEACEGAEEELSTLLRSQDALINGYLASLCHVDRLHREFEQVVGNFVVLEAHVAEVAEHARRRYAKLAERLQVAFTKHLQDVGWPPAGRLANADVFDRIVAPRLKKSGHRVAYILVDALRYELGAALQKQLAGSDQVDLQPAFAQLPTVTAVGMASLLPGAGVSLHLMRDGAGFVPVLDGVRLGHVTQRMEVLRDRFGDRFAEMPINSFVAGKQTVPNAAELLVLRAGDIDEHLEHNADTTLGIIQQTLKMIRVAIHKLRAAGFADVVIATDHGFSLNVHAEAGDVCAKPAGNWVMIHDRALLGEGAADVHNFVVGTEKVGIRGDFGKLAGPRSMAPYRRGVLYFHGGASLQETVVPVITVQLREQRQPDVTRTSVSLTYKNGVTRVTTRLPVVDLAVESSDMFSQGAEVEILLEAQDRKSNAVGEAKPGGIINAATGTLSLRPGQRASVTVRMSMEFEGKFTLKALNPVTRGVYASLDLETDYAV